MERRGPVGPIAAFGVGSRESAAGGRSAGAATAGSSRFSETWGSSSLRQVPALGDLPVVVDLGEDRVGEANHGWVVGEPLDNVGAPLDLFVGALVRAG
jgi:hypothetical protein